MSDTYKNMTFLQLRLGLFHLISSRGFSLDRGRSVKEPNLLMTKSTRIVFSSYGSFTITGNDGFITVRRQSLGQGNVFTPVCHSVHEGRGGLASQYASQVT